MARFRILPLQDVAICAYRFHRRDIMAGNQHYLTGAIEGLPLLHSVFWSQVVLSKDSNDNTGVVWPKNCSKTSSRGLRNRRWCQYKVRSVVGHRANIQTYT